MLGFFALGIVLIGFLHALRHYHVLQLFKKWRESVNEYYTDQKEWSGIVSADAARSTRFDWALLMAYVSFSCFIAGIIIGIFNFSTLTIGENHGRKETSITSTCAQANCTTIPINNVKGLCGGAGEQSGAKQPTTSTDPKKEIK